MNINLLKLFMSAGLLKKVKRTGWALKGVSEPESVAEHSFRVAFIAMILAERYKGDQLKMIKMALVHDLGESYIGDIKWESGAKIIASQAQKHKDESKAIEEIFSSRQEFIDLWQEFNHQKTKEARLVKLVDKLEMALQALEYEQEGNPEEWFVEFWENSSKYLTGSELEELFSALQKLRRNAS